MYLLEMGIFPKVNILFLVKCQTSNSYGRQFNIVKIVYHRKNTYMYNQLFETINEN